MEGCYACKGTQEYYDSKPDEAHISECSSCGKIYIPSKFHSKVLILNGRTPIQGASEIFFKQIDIMLKSESVDFSDVKILETLFSKICSALKRFLHWKTDVYFYSMIEYMSKNKNGLVDSWKECLEKKKDG